MVIFDCFGELIFVIEKQIKFESARDDLSSSTNRSLLDSRRHPVARIKFMSGSSDGTANTYIWDCTAGEFNWQYVFDETACMLEGSVVVKDEQGVPHTIRGGRDNVLPRRIKRRVDGKSVRAQGCGSESPDAYPSCAGLEDPKQA